jgi:hypothetical protein
VSWRVDRDRPPPTGSGGEGEAEASCGAEPQLRVVTLPSGYLGAEGMEGADGVDVGDSPALG